MWGNIHSDLPKQKKGQDERVWPDTSASGPGGGWPRKHFFLAHLERIFFLFYQTGRGILRKAGTQRE